MLSRRSEATPHRRRGSPPVQNSLFHLLRRRAPHLCGGHFRAIRGAPQSHPRVCLAVPAKQGRAKRQSSPGHRPSGSRDEPTSAPLRSIGRSSIRRAVPAKGTHEGGRRCKDGGSLDLEPSRILLLAREKIRKWYAL